MSENLITSELIAKADEEANALLEELGSEATIRVFTVVRTDNICDIIDKVVSTLSAVVVIIRWIPLPPVKKVVDILEKIIELLKRICP